MKGQRLSREEALVRLNLSNLFSLWESVGQVNGTLETHRGFRRIYNPGSSWPNRIWLSGVEDEERSRSALEDAAGYFTRKDEPILLVMTERQLAFSGDWLKERGMSVLFAQTGMVLDLAGSSALPREAQLEIVTVKTSSGASLWSQTASEAFGYSVGSAVIGNLVGLPEITLYLGFLPEGLAGTALLCTHHGVAGLHMAGTRPEHRRKGVARGMMTHLIEEARARGLGHATLQASAMGEPLYTQLGFRKQFLLHNYLYSTG